MSATMRSMVACAAMTAALASTIWAFAALIAASAGGQIRLRFRDRRIGCMFRSAGVVERLLGFKIPGRHRLDAGESGCRRIPQRFAGGDLGRCGSPLGFALPHHGFRRLNPNACAFQLGFSFVPLGIERLGIHVDEHLSGGDEVSFVHEYLGDAPWDFGVDVDLGPLDAAVSARKALGQPGRPQFQPCVVGAAPERENHDAPRPGACQSRFSGPSGFLVGWLPGRLVGAFGTGCGDASPAGWRGTASETLVIRPCLSIWDARIRQASHGSTVHSRDPRRRPLPGTPPKS